MREAHDPILRASGINRLEKPLRGAELLELTRSREESDPLVEVAVAPELHPVLAQEAKLVHVHIELAREHELLNRNVSSEKLTNDTCSQISRQCRLKDTFDEGRIRRIVSTGFVMFGCQSLVTRDIVISSLLGYEVSYLRHELLMAV
jgi:hypothetical protein